MQPWRYSPPSRFRGGAIGRERASRLRPSASSVEQGTRRAVAGSITRMVMRRDIQQSAAAAATANIVRTASRLKFTRPIIAFLRKVRTSARQLARQSQSIESRGVISDRRDGVVRMRGHVVSEGTRNLRAHRFATGRIRASVDCGFGRSIARSRAGLLLRETLANAHSHCRFSNR